MALNTRIFGLVTGLLGLAACGEYDTTVLKGSVAAVRGLVNPPEAPKSITPAQLRAKLTPELLAKDDRDLLIVTLVDGNATALFTQTGQNGATRTYAAPDGITLSLTDGVLVATRGLGFDLMSTDSGQIRASLARNGTNTYNRRYIHLDGENQRSVSGLRCRVAPNEGSPVISEICTSADQTIKNSYVRAPDGRPAASRQWISAERGYLLLEHVLR